MASASGVDPATSWRWDKALAADGVAGLVPEIYAGVLVGTIPARPA